MTSKGGDIRGSLVEGVSRKHSETLRERDDGFSSRTTTKEVVESNFGRDRDEFVGAIVDKIELWKEKKSQGDTS